MERCAWCYAVLVMLAEWNTNKVTKRIFLTIKKKDRKVFLVLPIASNYRIRRRLLRCTFLHFICYLLKVWRRNLSLSPVKLWDELSNVAESHEWVPPAQPLITSFVNRHQRAFVIISLMANVVYRKWKKEKDWGFIKILKANSKENLQEQLCFMSSTKTTIPRIPAFIFAKWFSSHTAQRGRISSGAEAVTASALFERSITQGLEAFFPSSAPVLSPTCFHILLWSFPSLRVLFLFPMFQVDDFSFPLHVET